MRIGELAARTGVSVRALRYYEEQSLLVGERSPNGQRHYTSDAVEQVELIQELYAAGLSSRVIAQLADHVADGRATPELIRRLAAERERLDQEVADLQRMRDRLDAVIGAATADLDTGQICERSSRDESTASAAPRFSRVPAPGARRRQAPARSDRPGRPNRPRP